MAGSAVVPPSPPSLQAERGYSAPDDLTVPPVYPLLVRALSAMLQAVRPRLRRAHPSSAQHHPQLHLPEPDAVVVAAVVVSFCSFLAAAVALFDLGLAVLRDNHAAYEGAFCFCWNPAAIFFTTACVLPVPPPRLPPSPRPLRYTESTFAALGFWGLSLLARLARRCGLSPLPSASSMRLRAHDPCRVTQPRAVPRHGWNGVDAPCVPMGTR